jgi:hypothetical protein
VAVNERLAALMTEAGFLDRSGTIGRKRFARAVTNAATNRGNHTTYTHTYVTRWLNGAIPRDPETRDNITTALSRALGRTVHQHVEAVDSLPELTWSSPLSSNIGLSARRLMMPSSTHGACVHDLGRRRSANESLFVRCI